MSNKSFRLLILITLIALLLGACGGDDPTPTPEPPATPTAVPTAAAPEPTAVPTEAAAEPTAAPEAAAPITETVATTETAVVTETAPVTDTAPAAETEAAADALANLTYLSEFTADGTAPLTDGEYREPSAPGSASETVVTLTDMQAEGELNGAPAAAVVLVTDPGGSGTFYDLAVVVDQDGALTNVATVLLGDRVQVNSVAIADNQIVVDMVTHDADDPLCCPTQQVNNTYALEGDQLTETSSEVIGTVEATAPVTGTQEITTAVEITAESTVTATETVTATSDAAAPAEAAAPSVITVESARSAAEIVNESYATGATVSPDGATMVWIQSSGRGRNTVRQMCLFTFANADKVCYEAPEEYYGYPYTLAWSPDSTWVAFTENPIELGHESDMWLFKRDDGTFVNRTDEGLTGSYMGAEVGSFNLDVLPMWNKSTDELYFVRVQPSGNFTMTIGIYRMPAEAGEPELVRDLTDTFSELLPWFDITFYFFDGPAGLSPDGSKVALLVQSYNTDSTTPVDGLWLVDLADTQQAPQHLATRDDFQAAVPAWLSMPATPLGLTWTADGQGLLAVAMSNDTHVPLRVFYYVDVASGAMTPVVDFSDIPDMESMHTQVSEDGVVLRYYSPWTGAMSPAGDQLLMVNDLGGVMGMMAAPLPPTGELPKVIFTSEEYSSFGETRASTSSDGKVVAYSTLFTLIEE